MGPAFLDPGDTLVAPSPDRYGRSLQDPVTMVADLRTREIGFTFLHERLDTTTPGGRLVLRAALLPRPLQDLDRARDRPVGAHVGAVGVQAPRPRGRERSARTSRAGPPMAVSALRCRLSQARNDRRRLPMGGPLLHGRTTAQQNVAGSRGQAQDGEVDLGEGGLERLGLDPDTSVA